VDWIKQGVLGQVREVHVWTNRPIWPQGVNRPADAPPVPSNIDWTSGSAPPRCVPTVPPITVQVARILDFGTGSLGDMGCHIIDIPFWALDLAGPCTVEAESGGQTPESGPLWSIVTGVFPPAATSLPSS